MPPDPGLSPRFAFRRLAVVLAGGGALGAYEAGVLRVLERAGLRPAVLAGTSIGAINAVGWLAHGGRAAAIADVWRRVRPATIGMRWTTLAVRAGGALLLVFGLLQGVLILLGSPEITLSKRVWGEAAERHDIVSVFLDVLAWGLVASLGAAAVAVSRRAEGWLAAVDRRTDPARLVRWLGRLVLAGLGVHLVAWGTGIPWPHSFSASLLVASGLAWLALRPGATGERLRRLLLRVMPETQGRGLWRGSARRALVEQLVSDGDPSRLTSSETLLVITALAMDSGRIAHFVSGPEPSPEFRVQVEQGLGEVIELRSPQEVIEAAVASSAIPLVFEPVRIRGRDFVDAGQFSNQPLAAVHSAQADAAVVVLLAPFREAPRTDDAGNVVDLGGRLVELANWRSLQRELRDVPAAWSVAGPGEPARVIVVAPEKPLPGGLFGFDPKRAAELIEQGESDAWKALEAGGWVDSGAV